jgi:hypothetical protein
MVCCIEIIVNNKTFNQEMVNVQLNISQNIIH